MAHNFKVGDRVRLKDLARGFAEQWGLTGTLVFAGINHAGHARFEGTGMVAHLDHLEPAPALIDATKQYRANGGEKVLRILCTDAPGYLPVVALLDDGTGGSYAVSFKADDLIEVKPEREGWVNLSAGSHGAPFFSTGEYGTKAEADEFATSGRIACLHVKFREGEGLS